MLAIQFPIDINKKGHYIYGLVEPDTEELRYIGFSSQILVRYRNHHKSYFLEKKTHKNDWIKSLLAKGQIAKIIIIEECATKAELPAAEVDMIAYFRFLGCDLTNSTEGGDVFPDHTGRKRSQEWCDNMSKGLKGRVSPNKGKTLSPEYRAAISEGSVGKPGTNTGKKFSQEWCDKIGDSQRGKPKPNGRRFSAEQEKEMCRLYVEEEYSLRQVAKVFDCYTSNVGHALKRNNITPRDGKRFTQEQELEMCRLYIEEKYSCYKIAKIFECEKANIKYVLKTHNIQMRSAKEAQELRKNK